jgi:hypothetical protein
VPKKIGGLKMLNQSSVSDLIRNARKELLKNGYSVHTMKLIERVWRNLEKHLCDQGLEYFSLDLGMKFLEQRYGITITQQLSESAKDQIRAINLLSDFQRQGTPSIRKRSKVYSFSPQFKEVFEGFIHFKINSGLSRRTTESYSIYLERFSEYLDNQMNCINDSQLKE